MRNITEKTQLGRMLDLFQRKRFVDKRDLESLVPKIKNTRAGITYLKKAGHNIKCLSRSHGDSGSTMYEYRGYRPQMNEEKQSPYAKMWHFIFGKKSCKTQKNPR